MAVGDQSRHFETALALGCAVDEQVAWPSGYVKGVDVGDDSSVLVVSSGGSIEPVLVAALPDADHASWGSAFHQMEGAELTWDGQSFKSIQMIRRDREPVSA